MFNRNRAVPNYRTLIEEILSRKAARAEIRIEEGKPGVDFSISLVPENPKAAPLSFDIAQKDFVFMHAGLGTTFEIPDIGGVNLPLSQKEQIEILTSAILDGRFEEDLTYAGDKIISGTGTVHLPDEDVRIKWNSLSLSALFKDKTTRQVKYQPYIVD